MLKSSCGLLSHLVRATNMQRLCDCFTRRNTLDHKAGSRTINITRKAEGTQERKWTLACVGPESWGRSSPCKCWAQLKQANLRNCRHWRYKNPSPPPPPSSARLIQSWRLQTNIPSFWSHGKYESETNYLFLSLFKKFPPPALPLRPSSRSIATWGATTANQSNVRSSEG